MKSFGRFHKKATESENEELAPKPNSSDEKAASSDENTEGQKANDITKAGGKKPADERLQEHRPDAKEVDASLNVEGYEKPDIQPENLRAYLEFIEKPVVEELVSVREDKHTEKYNERIAIHTDKIMADIHEKLDGRMLHDMDDKDAKAELDAVVDTVIAHQNFKLSPSETKSIKEIIRSDIFGLGPIEGLLANDDISDIMVDGPKDVYIEMFGQIKKTDVTFRSDQHLLQVCQRIVSRVGRHVDTASPICDARLPDGSRVNVILPPLALNGPELTIRKFKKERLTFENLVKLGTLDERTAALLQIIAASRVNILISGGTGSGKTTFLNCMTKYINPHERIITCEDAAELQLQQPQVVRLETRPANTEGAGIITMRDLVRNCLRMRPDRIIVGEVRGHEAFDLLQAMNTGHDGSMSTLHANSPRDALYRLESMVAQANLSIPVKNIREQIASSLEVLIHTQRLRDGSRKVMNISEISGMNDGMILMQDLVSFVIRGEDENGKILGDFKFSRLSPRFREKARHFNLESDLLELIGE